MILDEILAHKRREIEGLRRCHADWTPSAVAPARRDFRQALGGEGVSLIAEFKRRSPSRGGINPGALATEIARAYQRAKATALSVLTDHQYFGGNMGDLLAARSAVTVPVLRKDFIIDRCQIAESSDQDGPDCLLLIAAALEIGQLRALRELAARCGQAALVEAHNEAELERALESGAEIIGINNRDLKTFEVALETTVRLRPRVPAGIPVVSESGIHTRDDVLRLAQAGVDAMLIGEALMAADDPVAKIHELLGIR